MMSRREKINNVNAAKIMTNSLGHYNTFATLSATTNSPTFSIFIRPYAFVRPYAREKIYGFLC